MAVLHYLKLQSTQTLRQGICEFLQAEVAENDAAYLDRRLCDLRHEFKIHIPPQSSHGGRAGAALRTVVLTSLSPLLDEYYPQFQRWIALAFKLQMTFTSQLYCR